MKQNHDIDLTYGEDVVKLIASRCTEPESGGRMIDAILTNTLLPQISTGLLARIAESRAVRTVAVTTQNSEFLCEFV